ncbi:MAG: ABC transporter permease subunit [Candidatus Omnitrophica bacterium]|nr:ABC transporter permease subunit [Candidatus Omnitrophota bacterium]
MNAVWAVFQKDLGIYLKSYPAYLAAAVFLAVTGYFFYWELNYFSLVCYRVASSPELQGEGLNLTDAVLSTFFMNTAVVLLLVLPMVSMRSFAEERKLGTLETLLTYPASDAAVLSGKFISVWCVALIMVAPTAIFILISRSVGGVFDLRVVATAYTGLFLLCGAFAALGILTSVMTESQLVSVVLSFGFLVLFWMIGWGAEILGHQPAAALQALSIFEHFRNFTKGIVHVRDVVYFALFTLFFLIITKERLGTRRWAR